MLVYILLITGFVFLIKGAEALIDGASSLAKRFNISDLTIGLVIVAFGTSMPELTINFISNWQGASDIAIGNIIGACIANILLIAGVAAAIRPIRIKNSTAWKELPVGTAAIALLFFLANDTLINADKLSAISRFDGAILLIVFLTFIYYAFGASKPIGEENVDYEKLRLPMSLLYIVLGIAGLVIGGELVVENGIVIARNLGMSEALIGLTIISIGTTLPELTTSIVAVVRKSADIALGNIIGSTVFNVSFILGLNALIRPINFNTNLNSDILIAMLAFLVLFCFTINGKKKTIQRWEGVGLFSIYLAYLVFLIWRG